VHCAAAPRDRGRRPCDDRRDGVAGRLSQKGGGPSDPELWLGRDPSLFVGGAGQPFGIGISDTLLGRQVPGAFDTVVIEPRAESNSASPIKTGVIFLHGYAGSYTLECWLVASAARAIGAVTVCPATDFSGHWRGEAGEQIVRATLDYLHTRGIRRVFLAGLSSGAMGASVLAPRLLLRWPGLS